MQISSFYFYLTRQNFRIIPLTLSTTMHGTEPYLNLNPNEHENISIYQQVFTLSNQFDCSIHNCLCRRAKTGLILYPIDIQMKNVILLVCEQCYHYKLGNGTQHAQLEKWYFNIYQDSKSFHFKSGFLQNEDNSFCFSSAILDTNESLNIKERELDNWEKDAIQRIVQRKLDNLRV